jgi:hypothetical protein
LPSPTWSLRDEIDPLPLAIGALLMLTLVVQLARPATAPVPAKVEAAVRPAPTAPSVTAPDYPGILSRSLFAPGRGGAGGLGTDDPASTTLSDYGLVGVAIVKGQGTAILRGPTGVVRSLHEGDTLLGWRLAAIGRDSIVLRQGDVSRLVPVSPAATSKISAQ